MACLEIMDAAPPVLLGTDTVGKAVSILLERRYLALPVVDASRRYLGLFAKSRLFGLMLPSIVALEDLLPKIAQLTDLAYLSDDMDDLRERFAALRENADQRPVRAIARVARTTVHGALDRTAAILGEAGFAFAVVDAVQILKSAIGAQHIAIGSV